MVYFFTLISKSGARASCSFRALTLVKNCHFFVFFTYCTIAISTELTTNELDFQTANIKQECVSIRKLIIKSSKKSDINKLKKEWTERFVDVRDRVLTFKETKYKKAEAKAEAYDLTDLISTKINTTTIRSILENIEYQRRK